MDPGTNPWYHFIIFIGPCWAQKVSSCPDSGSCWSWFVLMKFVLDVHDGIIQNKYWLYLFCKMGTRLEYPTVWLLSKNGICVVFWCILSSQNVLLWIAVSQRQTLDCGYPQSGRWSSVHCHTYFVYSHLLYIHNFIYKCIYICKYIYIYIYIYIR